MMGLTSFLLCIIAALLAALVLAIIEQGRTFARGFDLGRSIGFREGRTSERDEIASEKRDDEYARERRYPRHTDPLPEPPKKR